MDKILSILKRQPPGRLIALGFVAVILLSVLRVRDEKRNPDRYKSAKTH